jgi:hypothetical protein
MLTPKISWAGALHPQKTFKISEYDISSTVLYLYQPANHYKHYTYQSLARTNAFRPTYPNPHLSTPDALKLAKMQPRVHRQGPQAPDFHNSDPTSPLGGTK